MNQAAEMANTTIVKSVFHPFSPQGVSGVVVIEESHLSIHTWPEHGYAAVDFFTCGNGMPDRAHEILRDGLQAESSEIMFIHRGLLTKSPSMTILSHRTENEASTEVHLSAVRQVRPTRKREPNRQRARIASK
jgi:S-adenosylmethionine decarboxylase proenzyme